SLPCARWIIGARPDTKTPPHPWGRRRLGLICPRGCRENSSPTRTDHPIGVTAPGGGAVVADSRLTWYKTITFRTLSIAKAVRPRGPRGTRSKPEHANPQGRERRAGAQGEE